MTAKTSDQSEWQWEMFKRTLQALAQPADVQLGLFPKSVVITDELALEFDNFSKVIISNFGSTLNPNQIAAIQAIDTKFNSMSGENNPSLWTDEALKASEPWKEIRLMAVTALTTFNYPNSVPVTDFLLFTPTSTEVSHFSPWKVASTFIFMILAGAIGNYFFAAMNASSPTLGMDESIADKFMKYLTFDRIPFTLIFFGWPYLAVHFLNKKVKEYLGYSVATLVIEAVILFRMVVDV